MWCGLRELGRSHNTGFGTSSCSLHQATLGAYLASPPLPRAILSARPAAGMLQWSTSRRVVAHITFPEATPRVEMAAHPANNATSRRLRPRSRTALSERRWMELSTTYSASASTRSVAASRVPASNVVIGVVFHACRRSRMRAGEPTREISSAN